MSDPNRQIDWGTTVVSAAIAAAAVLALWQAQEFSANSAIFPLVIGGVLLVGSLAVLARSLMRNKTGSNGGDSAAPAGLRYSLALIAVMACWILALEWAGFAIASFISFVALALITDGERPTPRRATAFAAVGIAVVGGLQLVFQYGLKVRLPAGELLPRLLG